MVEYSERRKADRLAMATILEGIITAAGAAFTRDDNLYEGDESLRESYKHCIQLSIDAPGDLGLTIRLNGKSVQPDVHVLSWHMHYKSDNRLSDAFGCINTVHYHKATDVAYGFESLCEVLREKLVMCADGSAYSPERAERAKAKRLEREENSRQHAESVDFR